ncbi:hypothetical protein KIN34_14285 [Cellulomonas sp. DKR-3]|uniref:GNAT family N-acetyltransferase n=1 Tax=Cellulomonas fulva TaxID=2835530 RepID=A0ABS5U241_9CELL|nr:hypothetical protein [Cellulomonas fulva]MBT0995452.1 hypothetical protein [Cellulomonas fulva]
MTRPTLGQAVAVFREQAWPNYVAAADRLVAEGAAEWVPDPAVPSVFALVRTGTDAALAVVYAPVVSSVGVVGRKRWDWETSEDFDALVYGQEAGR